MSTLDDATRTSARPNKGKPPERYGEGQHQKQQQQKLPPTSPSKSRTSETSKTNKTVKSKSSVKSTTSSITRKRLELALEEKRKKAQLDNELMEVKRKEKEIINRQEILAAKMDLKKLDLDGEQSEEEADRLDPIDNDSILSVNHIKRWMEEGDPEPPQYNNNEPFNYNNLFLARQSVGRDLPEFNGDPAKWTTFLEQFNRTTRICGFSPDENLTRLQKCLKGMAADAVRSLLVHPNNVTRAMEMLELRFGRVEQVLDVVVNRTLKAAAPRENDFESLIAYANEVESLVQVIKSLKCPEELHNRHLKQELFSKLPGNLKFSWAEEIHGKKSADVKLDDFARWLTNKAKIACSIKSSSSSSSTENPRRSRGDQRRAAVFTASEKDTRQCDYCAKGPHKVVECRSFARLTINDKYIWAKEKRFCFSCLQGTHRNSECPTKKRCGIHNCAGTHHKLLHPTSSLSSIPAQQPQNNATQICSNNANLSGHVSTQTSKVFLRIAPVTLTSGPYSVETFALLDEGSTISLIDEKLANSLRLRGPRHPLSLNWIDGSCNRSQSHRVNLMVHGSEGEFKLTDVRTVKNLNLPLQSLNLGGEFIKWNHLKDLPISRKNTMGKPLLLLGQDHRHLITPLEVREGPRGAPAASKSRLGWTIHGKVVEANGAGADHVYLCVEEGDDNLHNLIKNSFSSEDFGVKIVKENPQSRESDRALELFSKITRKFEGRWETGLLWKNPDCILPESYNSAYTRLLSLERKLEKNPEMLKSYQEKLDNNSSKGYSRLLSPEEVKQEGPRTWYLPHFAALNPNKPGSFRLVFDAAALSNGVSLNSQLSTGPDLLNSLPGTLFKFREGRVAFSGDIREMFLRIRMRGEDADSQRFLWRGMDRSRPPDVYRMEVVLFGSASSPFSAQQVKNVNAQAYKEEFPDAYNAIVNRHYMDDYLDSVDSIELAKKLIFDVSQVHRAGGFEIAGWSCSHPAALVNIPPEDRSTAKRELVKDDSAAERVLGLSWDSALDTLSFTTKFPKSEADIINGQRQPTKRQMLSLVASLFDPLGLLAHLTVKAKMLLQDVWRSGIGWDDQIPSAVFIKWVEWLSELKSINFVSIPRCYSQGIPKARTIQLHIFCDASEKAFAAAAYFRVEREDGQIDTALIMARTRVAPTRPMSIPRLELQAALMGARLANTVKINHRVQPSSSHYWTDSRTVLCWLRADARTFKQFVGFRLGEILETTEVKDWRWVPTAENVADDATRNNEPSDMTSGSRWWKGPSFLLLPDSMWPKEKSEPSQPILNTDEIRKDFVNFTNIIDDLIHPGKYSNFNKMTRVTAQVFRFISRCRKKAPWTTYLTPIQLTEAKNYLLKRAQLDSFEIEVKALQNGAVLPKGSRLHQLNPVLEDGLLKLNGRLVNSPDVPEPARKPIILDPQHQLTRLIVRTVHEEWNHQGTETIVNELRQHFWILQTRAAVRHAWVHCQQCKNRKAATAVPTMAPLPDFRTTRPVRAFQYTGLDYFGPMDVTIGRRHEKRYGALFCCLSTRAVHIEVAASLTTDSAIMALRRFIARRGTPAEIHSDNGTNFKGAARELENLDHQLIMEKAATRGITWKFIPPSSPHMGGAWERLVKSIKTALDVTLKSRAPREETLFTLLAEAEFTVNSHPLTLVSSHPDDYETLTPNHFLLGSSGGVQPLGLFSDSDLHLRKQWRLAQRLADHFWSRWIKEYLPTLAPRKKWTEPTRPVQIGDVGLLIDPNSPRNTWPKCIITALHPGKDGLTRVVDIRTSTGTLRRPIAKIALFDIPTTHNLKPTSM